MRPVPNDAVSLQDLDLSWGQAQHFTKEEGVVLS